MTAQIIDGKAIAEAVRADLRGRAESLAARTGIVPKLRVILVGEDPASQSYVRGKNRAARQAAIDSDVIRLPAGSPEDDVLRHIDALNADDTVHGILVQLPLPRHISEQKVTLAIDPAKDVDGFHPVNVGRMHIGLESFLPCTPHGIVRLLDRTGVPIAGSHAVVVGRSNIVGKPVAMLLLARHATVTVAHSRTPDLGAITRQADILVVAAGRAGLVTGDMVKPGATVIDVGVNRVDDRLVGDVDFHSASQVAGAITPVPGGVGPMTIAMLLENTVISAERAAARMAGVGR